jgi:branched-chain amino acid transport system ATP-binding protein
LAPDAPASRRPILALDGVVAGYGGAAVLHGVNFVVPRATITTIVGPNGAGKSTVFKTVAGLVPVRRGKVWFEGRETTHCRPWRMAELGLCYVPQGRNAFPGLSVRHNLELGGQRLRSARALAGRIDAVLEHFPSLRDKLAGPAGALPPGEQKLLEVARALVSQPSLMLIDEPSLGLPAPAVAALFAALADLRGRGITVVLVEQNAKSALGLSDVAVVMELGRVRHQDRAAAVLADPRIGPLFLGGPMGSTPPPLNAMAWMPP